MMTECAPVTETKSKEKRGKPLHRRRMEKSKGSTVDEEIVDGFAMASFACLQGDEIQASGATADSAVMSKRREEQAVVAQKRKASPNRDKNKTKHHRANNSGETNSSDESTGGSSGVRSKQSKKKPKHQNQSESQNSDRGYQCDSESEGDVKGCESEHSDQVTHHRMLRPGPGNLNDLFKVAAKERSNLKKQSSNLESNQGKGSKSNVSSAGAPSRAPYQPGGDSNSTNFEGSKKPGAVPASHPHFQVPEHVPPEVAAAYMMPHRSPFPIGIPATSSSYSLFAEQQQPQRQSQQSLVQAHIQHQHQHRHEHQHHHQHQHQFSLHGSHHLAAAEHLYGGSVVPPTGPSAMQHLGLPYGIHSGLSLSSSVPFGVGPSAFQPKKQGQWCAVHGHIAWYIYQHKHQKFIQAHIETQKELQAKAEAAASQTPSLGVYNSAMAFHPKVPIPGLGMMSEHGVAEVVRPVIPHMMAEDRHTESHDGVRGFPLHPRPHPIGLSRPLESESSRGAMMYGSYPGLNVDKDGRPFHPLYSMMPWNMMKKESIKADELHESKEGSKEGKKKSRDKRNSEVDHSRSGVDTSVSAHQGFDHVKSSSSAFSSVGTGPSIGSGLGIGAFVNHNSAASVAAQHISGKTAAFSGGVTSTMLNSMKSDPKPEAEDKPASKLRESPKRSSATRLTAASPSSPKRPANQHSPPITAPVIPRRMVFGNSHMQSFGPSPGHLFGSHSPFMGFPGMGPGGMMMPTFGSPIGMLNMHPAAAAAACFGHGQHSLMGFEDRPGLPVTKS